MATAICTHCRAQWRWRAGKGSALRDLRCTNCGHPLRKMRSGQYTFTPAGGPFDSDDSLTFQLGTSIAQQRADAEGILATPGVAIGSIVSDLHHRAKRTLENLVAIQTLGKSASGHKCSEAHPCHPDREAHRIAAYLFDTGRLREGVSVREVAEVIVMLQQASAD